jgi:hypothetical protein
VSDHEVLHLLISYPQHVFDTGELRPELAEQIDSGGLSVLRSNAADAEFIATVEELKQRSQARGIVRFVHGVLSFTAGSVRYDERQRFMCVYDTALPSKPHHPDVMGPTLGADLSKSEQKRQQRRRIKKFIDLVGPGFETVTTFREGVLSGYARPASD